MSELATGVAGKSGGTIVAYYPPKQRCHADFGNIALVSDPDSGQRKSMLDFQLENGHHSKKESDPKRYIC